MLDPNPMLERGVRCGRECKWCHRPLIAIGPPTTGARPRATGTTALPPTSPATARLVLCPACDNPFRPASQGPARGR